MYYLYIYLDPRKPGHYSYPDLVSFLYEPIYVGKGRGSRANSHIREVNWKTKSNFGNRIKTNKIKSILKSGHLPIVLIAETGDQDYILKREFLYIEKIGRLVNNTGTLTNIRPGGMLPGKPKRQSRKGNGRQGSRQHTITDGTKCVRINEQQLQEYLNSGFTIVKWKRVKKENSKSRNGIDNPMYQKSAVKGRKWVTTDDQQCLFLTFEEIKNLSCNFYYGRILDKNKRKRIIVKGSKNSKYMSDAEIENLPIGTEYQVGLIWNDGKETYLKK